MLKRITALLLTALLIFSIIPTPKAEASQNGMIRVRLNSLGTVSSVNMRVSGYYSADGQLFSSGTSMTVTASGGSITLTADGTSHSMGASFTLKRHSDSSGNAGFVTISNASFGSRSYMGDFTFYASGSTLTVVNTVYMEHYLVGVVGNEMDNAWPIEALKAQAVAARTYAYMNMKSSGTYDIGDTASDQVYKGYRSSDDVVIRAVNATKGILATYGGQPFVTYYGASNGGETELPSRAWSDRTSPGCYVVKRDPYDVKNNLSLISSVYFTSSGNTGSTKVEDLIKSKVASRVGTSASSVSISSYMSVELSNPQYSNSINYQTVEVTVMTNMGQYTVSLSAMDEIKPLLNLDYNLRMVRLDTTSNLSGFIFLDFCRYGHGVGLSQRGAQQMATEGWSYEQILSFYYEGVVLRQYELSETSPTPYTSVNPGSGSGSGAGTVGGSPVIATATVSASSLNVRASASTSASSLGKLSSGQVVNILSMESGWARIQYGSGMGYVSAQYLSSINYTSQQGGSAPSGNIIAKANIVNSTGAFVYSEKDIASTRLGTVSAGGEVQIYAFENEWAKVDYQGATAYLQTVYLTNLQYVGSSDSGTSANPIAYGYVSLNTTTSAVILREQASENSSAIDLVFDRTLVTIYGEENGFYSVEAGGRRGFILKSYISGYMPMEGGSSGGGTATAPGGNTATELNIASKATSACTVYNDAAGTQDSGEKLSKGEAFTVTEISGSMVRIKINAMRGWIEMKHADGVTAQSSGSSGNTGSTGNTGGDFTDVNSSSTAVTTAGVNMRQGESTTSSIITLVPKGKTVSVLSRGTLWSKVSYGGKTGYINNAYLTFSSSGSSGGTTTPPASSGSTAETTTTVNMRASGSTDASIVTKVPGGRNVTVISRGSSWSNVSYDGKTGYIINTYLKFASASAGVTTPPAQETTSTATATANVNLRQSESISSSRLTTVPGGAKVTVLARGSEWTKVSYGSYAGYIKNEYLDMGAAGSSGSSGGSQTQTPDIPPISTGDSSGAATGDKASTTANVHLRSGEGTSFDSLGTVPKGAQVSVVSKGSAWSKVTYSGKTGYIRNDYLTTAAESESSSGSSTASSGTLTTNASVNMRVEASTSADKITTLAKGTIVEVIQKGSNWTKVRYNGREGYVSTKYLDDPSATQSGSSGFTYWRMVTLADVILRKSASTSSDRLATVRAGTPVNVLEIGDEWSKMIYGVNIGYVKTEYLAEAP